MRMKRREGSILIPIKCDNLLRSSHCRFIVVGVDLLRFFEFRIAEG